MENGRIPKSGELYRHFKNKLYQVIGVAEHSETKEEMVVYQALYGDFKLYVRPLSMFMEEVDRSQYPAARQKYRFEKVERDKLHLEKNLRSEAETKRDAKGLLEESASGLPNQKNSEGRAGKTEQKTVTEPAETAAGDWKAQIELQVNGLKAEIVKEAEKQREEFEAAVREMEMSHLEAERQEETVNPLLLQFLDTDTYKQKLELFLSMKKKIDNRLIDDIAVALDVVVEDGPLEVRYEKLRSCIETMERFECDRFI